MGEKEKGQGGGRQSRQAPQRIPERQSHPATTRASSPQGATVARSASAARVQSRGCKGRSPLHKKTQKSPPSPEGKSALRARAGGWGKKRKVKAAGGKAGKPPSGFRKGRVIRRPLGQAPRRVPQWQGQPVPPGFSPGDARGEAPCIRKPKNPPFPPGRGLGGWGRKNYDTAGKAGAAGTSHPAGQQRRQGKPGSPSVPPLNAPACGA